LLSIPFVLVGLHRVPSIEGGHLAITPPPSSFLHADIFASLAGKAVSEFPNSSVINVPESLSSLLCAGWIEVRPSGSHGPFGLHRAFWLRRISLISPVRLDGTLNAGFSRLHRTQGWSVHLRRLNVAELLSVSFTPSNLSNLNACHLALKLRTKLDSLWEQLNHAVRWRTRLKSRAPWPQGGANPSFSRSSGDYTKERQEMGQYGCHARGIRKRRGSRAGYHH
jgi:hypothetical protein